MSDAFERAQRLIPGGVSSPARAFGAVGGDPIFASRGEGAYIFDADGNRYIDYIQGFGSIILGHADPRVTEAVQRAAARGGATGLSSADEVELAGLIVDSCSSIDRVRFMSSGTEASMTAARIARAATGRDVIVKFEGCYHGHADVFLAKAGSGVATFAIPMAAGVPAGSVADTIVLPFNDISALECAFDERGSEIAAVFVEPIAANMGVIEADLAFLSGLLRLCRTHGSVSVFDEVVTGFRVRRGGFADVLGVSPDLTMLGKVIGGGLPIGAVGGRADLMDLLAPKGTVYQAGTFAAHPHAMAAGVAVLSSLGDEDYKVLAGRSDRLLEGLRGAAPPDLWLSSAETFLSVFFGVRDVTNFTRANSADKDAFGRFQRALRARGVLIPPSPFEAWFPSLAHTDEEIEATVEAASAAFEEAR